MKRRGMTLALAILAGCSPTTRDLEESSTAVRQDKTYSESYQEVYRRLYTTATACQSLGGSAEFRVDGQLYSELGFGEITMSMLSIYGSNFYWKARVDRSDKGSRLSVVSGNTLAKKRTLSDVIRWADGETAC